MPYSSDPHDLPVGKIIGYMLLVLFVLILLGGSMGTVGAGSRGVLVTLGKVSPDPVQPGFYFKPPFISSMHQMNVQTQRFAYDKGGADDQGGDLQAASKDLQTVDTSVSFAYHIKPESTPWLFQNVGTDYNNKIVAPVLRESVKAVTARYTAEELVTKRDTVRDDIVKELHGRLDSTPVVIEDFNIVNFSFGKEYAQSIETKAAQVQNTQTALLKKQQTQAEADQAIIAATGQAEANRKLAESVKASPEILQLRAIEKWDGHLPQVSSGAVPFINLTPAK